MADIFDEFITPAELTGYARAGLADRAENAFSLARWLPNRFIDDLVYRFQKNTTGLIEAAHYRAFDAEPGFGSREGTARVTGELPPIGRQMLLNEYDQLRLRNAAGAEGNQLRDLLLRDAERLTRQVDARFELARGHALVTGKVTLNESEVVAEADFGRKAGHTVTAGTAWSDHANATPIDDLQSWSQTYTDSNGESPAAALSSTTVIRHLLQSDQLKEQIYPLNPNRRLTRADVNGFLADMGLPIPVAYDAKIKYKGAETRIIPEDKFLFLPAPADPNDEDGSQLGATLWGTTLESLEPQYQIEDGDQPGIVVAATKTRATPIQVITVAAAIGIPILANPDLSFCADVLA